MFGRRLLFVMVRHAVVAAMVNSIREQRHRQPMRGLEGMITTTEIETTIEIETEVAVITMEEMMIEDIITIRDETIIMGIAITAVTEIETEDIHQNDNGGGRTAKGGQESIMCFIIIA